MNKRYVIALVAFLTVIIGALVFYKFNNRKYNLTLESKDGKVRFDLGKICDEKPSRCSDLSYTCKVTDLSLDKMFDGKDIDSVVYLDDDYKKSDSPTNKCYIGANNHYFYFCIDNENSLIYNELISGFYPEESDGGYMVSPFYDEEGLKWKEKNVLTWKDTVGLSSFEELVKFYEKTDSSLYEIDKENQMVTVKLFGTDGNVSGDKATVTVEGEEIAVELIKD